MRVKISWAFVRKALGLMVLNILSLTAVAADPGGYLGFVKAVFTGSECDTTSDVFATAKTWVFVPEEMYAKSCLAEKTTVAYGGYMYMEKGVRYDFKGCYDDYVTVKIGSTWVLSQGGECKERTGSYTPTATDWYKVDLRVANNGAMGGCQNASQYGILWKAASETTWHKFAGASERFMSGTLSSRIKADKPYAEIISAQMRETDPTVMDVKYRVYLGADKVNVRALAFEDGVRSFANVVRPTTFLEGSVIGDNVPANTVNSFAWKVSADWKIDLAQVSVEVLAQDVGAGLVPLDLVTIPAHGNYGDVTCSTNIVSDAQYLDALYWLYADGDADLSLKDGWLRDAAGRILVKGTALQNNGYAAEFVYGKMGYDAMGTNCKRPHTVVAALSRVRRVEMPYSGNHRYAVKGFTEPPAQTMGNGLYMVIDLDSTDYSFTVSYLDAAPATWGDEYKTRKIVLRRIDMPSGAYYAGVFAVTEAQWDKVMGGSSTSTKPNGSVSYNAIRGDAGVYDWPGSNAVAAESFMGVLRQMTGISTFDLPSEDEWVYAARAGVTTTWLCGDSETGLDDYAWYNKNSDGGTHPVGTRRANAWGLYDVHGNVWEWCLDRWSSVSGLDYMVLRGGSFYSGASSCAFSYRSDGIPSGDSSDRGFRLFCRPGSN